MRIWIQEAREGARRPKMRFRRGMTLMEVTIVVAIILLVTSTLTYGLMGAYADMLHDNAKLIVLNAGDKVRMYEVRNRRLPDSLSDAYSHEPPPDDPWGHTLAYEKGRVSTDYDVASWGADGLEGGEGRARDIRLSELSR